MSNNPLEALFRSAAGFEESASVIHSQFVRSVFAQAKTTDVALFIDQPNVPVNQHVFLRFFGGSGDRLALKFVCRFVRIQGSVRVWCGFSRRMWRHQCRALLSRRGRSAFQFVYHHLHWQRTICARYYYLYLPLATSADLSLSSPLAVSQVSTQRRSFMLRRSSTNIVL